MRVLLVPYPGTFELVGGHVTQQIETARALERAGVEARIASIDEALTCDADIVHAFGDIRPMLALGRPKGRLIASPIYFPSSVVLGPMYWRGGRRQMLEVRVRHRAGAFRRPSARRRRTADFRAMHVAWRQADAIVVNSRAEGLLLQSDAAGFDDLRVAYSGVGQEAFHGDAHEGRRLLGIGDEPFVLSVARVEPIKNHLSLAHAVEGLALRLVLVGAVLPGNERYFEAVREAAPDLIHVPHIEHALLRHVHAAAAVHALPSWFETTGLSTLEAMAVGRPVVVSGGPCVDEYFGDCATTCDPGRIGSIRSALQVAARGPRGCERTHAGRYSWDNTAQQLIAAYAE